MELIEPDGFSNNRDIDLDEVIGELHRTQEDLKGLAYKTNEIVCALNMLMGNMQSADE